MKKTIFSAIVMAFIMVSCNQKSKEVETSNTEKPEAASEMFACPMHPEVTGKKGDKCSKCGMELTEPVTQKEGSQEKHETETTDKKGVVTTNQSSFSTDEIVGDYLKLKNALTKDDSKGAANSAKALYATFNKVNSSKIDSKLKKEYIEIAEDAKEHAEHIGDNAGKIDHQREHFAILSKDINDLVKLLGSNQKLYQDHCPMYNEGKGAIWISETKEIKNPYYGAQMLTCGSLKKTL